MFEKFNYPTTKEYDEFKTLPGNRPINAQKVQNLMADMKANGVHRDCVIKINENAEIIDGQHRFLALKSLGLEIPYIIIEGGSVEECVKMNTNQSPWRLTDFVFSGAIIGNKDYKNLHNISVEYPIVPLSVILKIITRRVTGVATSGIASKAIRSWTFKFPDELYQDISDELSYISKFEFVRRKNKHGRGDILFNAIAACYECPVIDNDRLLERMTDSTERFGAFNTFKECLERVQEVYNLYSRRRIYLSHEVQQMLDAGRKEFA